VASYDAPELWIIELSWIGDGTLNIVLSYVPIGAGGVNVSVEVVSIPTFKFVSVLVLPFGSQLINKAPVNMNAPIFIKLYF